MKPLEGSVVRTEDERPLQQVVPQSTHRIAKHFFSMDRDPLGQLPADVKHRAVDLHLLRQNDPQPPVSISLQDKREREVRCVEKGLSTEGPFDLLKRQLAWLHPLDRIWGAFLGEVGSAKHGMNCWK